MFLLSPKFTVVINMICKETRLHPSGFCVSSSEKLMTFMHFHNSSTRNCDHHILLIMTGNAHKESYHKLSLIRVREYGLHIFKTDCSGKMVVAFTIKKLFNGKPILPIGAAAFRLMFVVLSS